MTHHTIVSCFGVNTGYQGRVRVNGVHNGGRTNQERDCITTRQATMITRAIYIYILSSLSILLVFTSKNNLSLGDGIRINSYALFITFTRNLLTVQGLISCRPPVLQFDL